MCNHFGYCNHGLIANHWLLPLALVGTSIFLVADHTHWCGGPCKCIPTCMSEAPREKICKHSCGTPNFGSQPHWDISMLLIVHWCWRGCLGLCIKVMHATWGCLIKILYSYGIYLCSWQLPGWIAHRNIVALNMNHVSWQTGHGWPTLCVCHACATHDSWNIKLDANGVYNPQPRLVVVTKLWGPIAESGGRQVPHGLFYQSSCLPY